MFQKMSGRKGDIHIYIYKCNFKRFLKIIKIDWFLRFFFMIKKVFGTVQIS